MTDFFAQPDDLGEIRQSELHASLGERLGAQALDALDAHNSISAMWLARRSREFIAGGDFNRDFSLTGMPEEQDFQRQQNERGLAAIPETSIEDAKARVKQEGLEGHLKLPDQPSVKSPVLDLMISEAHERRDREAAIARGPQGFVPGALGFVTSIGAGMVDPVNMAAFSIPVLGEARWGKLLYNAGDSLMARAGVKALQGGAQGAVGTAALQPIDWWLHTRDGEDYTLGEALKSVAMGAAMGGAFHAGFGAIGDVRARLKGEPLKGSPEDLATHALMTGRIQAEEGAPAPEPVDLKASPEIHPAAEALADLPPAAREDALRATVADIAADQPARAAEILDLAASHDPRIGESINPPDEIAGRIEQLTKDARGLGSPMDIAAASRTNPEAVYDRLDAIRSAGIDLERDIKKKYGIRKSEDLEDAPLTPAERHFLFYEESPVDRERIGEIIQQLQPVENLGEASREIAYELKRLPKDPSNLNHTERLAVMRLQVLFSEVERLGGDLNSVIKSAGQKYASRFEDPEDALFMAQNAADRLRSMFAQPNEPAAPQALSHGQRLLAAAADPRWRELADRTPAELDPDVVAESKAAENLPEPDSFSPERSLTALEKQVADAEEAWRALEPTLSEEEKAAFDAAFAALKEDRDTRDQVIKDGAACLMGAVG